MKIKAVELHSMSIPLITPFRTALRIVRAIENIVVKIITDSGEVGYGEAPPTAVITGDTTGAIVGAIKEAIAPKILGADISDIDGIMKTIQSSLKHNTSAKAAVDMAIYDLYGQLYDAPLYKLLGGSRNRFETDVTISVNAVSEMVNDSVAAVQKGFKILKIKVGDGLGDDVERVKAIRRAVGDGITLRIDANQGWRPKEAVKIIRAMEDGGLAPELVEQPVKAADLDGLRFVTKNVYTPILADESVFSAADAVDIIQTQAADMINIKLMKTGGIHEALKLCTIAEVYGVECMVGSMLEGNIAVTAAAHLAAAKSQITRADLDGPSLATANPVKGGAVHDNGNVVLPDAPGLGITGIEGLTKLWDTSSLLNG